MRQEQIGTGQYKKSVLLVEPDESERFAMIRAFLASDWLLVTARNQDEALQELRERSFLVVITGLEQAEEIRRVVDEHNLGCKVVVAVRFSDETGAGSTLPTWAYSVLRKPFAQHEVLQVLGFAWAYWRHRAMLKEVGFGLSTLFVSSAAA